MKTMRWRQARARTSWYGFMWEIRTLYVCGVCVLLPTGLQTVRTPTHRKTHTNKSLDETPRTQSRDLIPSLSYLCIGQVPWCAIKRKKGGKHKPGVEEYVPFEVVFLLGSSFGVARLVKQIIKCNGWGGLQSFIADGKNKVLDDLGDSGAGFDGNSHACWNSLVVLTDRCYHKSRVKELQLYILKPKVYGDKVIFWQIISSDWRFSLRQSPLLLVSASDTSQ